MAKTLTIKINGWKDFTKVAKLMSGEDWLFRGHEDADWKLDSSLDRDMATQLGGDESKEYSRLNEKRLREAERFAIETFRLLAGKEHLFGSDDVDVLATMQHYGTKTRLLDFSTSIYVALFFAFEKKITRKPRSIYAIRYNDIVDLAKLKAEFKDLVSGSLAGENDGRRMGVSSIALRKFIFDIARKNIAEGDSHMGVLPLYTIGTNERLAAQAGMFLMPRNFAGLSANLADTLNVSEEELNVPTSTIKDVAHKRFGDSGINASLVRLLFDPSLEKSAWDILDQANISPRTIFPDLEGIAKSIRYSNRFLRLGLK